MRTVMMGLLAETSLHPGTESSTGVVDLPVAREVVTQYPVIVGSSLKGALKDKAGHSLKGSTVGSIFGAHDNAGQVMVGDARLLLLPVRSLSAPYRWVTCPYVLERFQRDLSLAGRGGRFAVPAPDEETAVAAAGEGRLFLEEVCLNVKLDNMEALLDAIGSLVYHQSVRDRLAGQLTVISNNNFQYFARYGLQVNARNNLDVATKTSKNLWYEETVAPDTLFYAVVMTRPGMETALDDVRAMFHQRPYLQIGGNETVGQGWCCVTWTEAGGGADA
ncbi:MAG: type III-B CRISPR module RAMP protein Cmr4 [Peptococcaceae bacterium]|nr:type III-B CRISPR module RAMP protein Cmr4 [Peptococcaceae bacterium]